MRIMGVLAIGALAGLVGCAQGPAPGPVVAQSPVAAPLQEAAFTPPPVGRQMTWQLEDGGQLTSTVTAVDAGSYSSRNDRGEEATDVTPFIATVAWSLQNAVGRAEVEGDPRSLFPLRVGNSAEWTRRGTDNGQPFLSRTRCTVADTVRVEVPAGAFDTFKIACIAGSDLRDPSARTTFYYAPEVAAVVRYHRTSRDGTVVRDRQLLALGGPALGETTAAESD